MSVLNKRTKNDAVVGAAERAFLRAEYDMVSTLLDIGVFASPAARARGEIVRARTARVLDDLVTWHRAATFAARNSDRPGERAAALALLAVADRRKGTSAAADRHRAEAEELIERTAPAQTGMATYFLATDAWERRDFEGALQLAGRTISTGRFVAESRVLIAWTHIKREEFTQAALEFGRALDEIENPDDRIDADIRNIVGICQGAISVACDTIDLRLGARARAVYRATPVPKSLDWMTFNIERGLRFIALLEGDLDAAFVAARKTAVVAPSPTYAAIGEAHAAEVAQLLGDRSSTGVQLRAAWAAIRDADWSAADAEQRMALTTFALVAGRTMPAEARKAIMIYQSVRPKLSPGNSLDEDRRVVAYDFWAAGRMQEILGDSDAAIALYRQSQALWTELGYPLRNALVALDLRRLIGGSSYRAAVEAVLLRAPKAWIGGEVNDPIPALRHLRAAQRQVLQRMLEGFSAKGIATDLGRSHFTVINHTRKIFAAFDVHTRDELFRACRDQGITPDLIRSSIPVC